MQSHRLSDRLLKHAVRNGRDLGTVLLKRLNSSTAHIIGCFQSNNDNYNLTSNAKEVNLSTNNELVNRLKISKFDGKAGKTRLFYGLGEAYPCVAVVGLGEQAAADFSEDLDVARENTRIGLAAAISSISSHGFEDIYVDPCDNAFAAAESVYLSSFKFQKFKTKEEAKKPPPNFRPICNLRNDDTFNSWKEGQIYAEAQNFARFLMEMPSNYKYPLKFADAVKERFRGLRDTEIITRDKAWLEKNKMDCFLSVSQGSVHTPLLLEVHYGPKSQENVSVALVGKGITFDSGGISLKPSQGMSLMKGDMGGAACVLGAMDAISRLNLPIKVVALIALSENMPSGAATKPGDVFTAMNGKTVEVDNTDAEGRLVLADTLCYAHKFNPSTIIDLATLTGAIDVALGAGAAGAFCNSDKLWKLLSEAGNVSGDRLWRMPMYKYYSKQMDCSSTADLRNTQEKARSAGACTAAAFLKEFVEMDSWAHIDIAGVMSNEGSIPYLGKGMSGRPTRTIIQLLSTIAKGEM